MIDEKLKQEFIEKFGEEAFEDLLSKKDSFKNKDFNAILQWYLKYQKPETISVAKQQQQQEENLKYFEIDNGTLIGFKDEYKNNYPEKIVIPSSVTSIGWGAFFDCTGLSSITIPESVESIGNYTFRDCKGLKSITIPESVESIGYGAFRYCKGLKSITYQGTKSEWSDILKGGYWNSDTGNYTIHCTDGDIAK